MKTTYNEIEITYNENDNRWGFELRGRQRYAESLAKAKEAIDKEPVEKRKQVFPRFNAYYSPYGDDYKIISVTSIAEHGYSDDVYFWIITADGRKKEPASSLYPVNEKNTAVINRIKALKAEVAKLEKIEDRERANLQCATLPKELQ